MIKDKIIVSLQKVTGLKKVNLEFPAREEFGDYTSNVALQSKNPKEEAKKIVEKLKKDQNLKEIIEKIEIAGPGFINFHLNKKVLVSNLSQILETKDYGSGQIGKGKVVVIDYSAPNIAKRFSIGHLRSTIIGQAIYNLHKFLGYTVIGDNHLGDWGTQFGVLIYMVESTSLDPKKLSIEEWEKLYVEFHSQLDKNPDLKDKAREAFKRLEEDDKKAKEIWKAAYDISIKEYERIYKLLNVKIDYTYGESFYQDKMDYVINVARKKGLAKKGEEGALIIEFPNMPPGMLVKSDSTTTYFTRDLATIKYRISSWNPDIFIYEVGSDQTLHFKQVFEAAKLLGWTKKRKFVHIAHGLVRFKEGKMSTRRGKTIKLEEILTEAIEKAKEYSSKGRSTSGRNSDPEVARSVGIGAIKYFDLMHAPTSNIIFDWKKIFVLEGNSGPYLQYTAARANSVVRKAKFPIHNFQFSKNSELNSEELLVLRELIKFPEIVQQAALTYSPNLLCNYLFELAQKYNGFYNKHKIIGSKEQDFRFALTFATGQVLKTGLTLLGIAAPEKM